MVPNQGTKIAIGEDVCGGCFEGDGLRGGGAGGGTRHTSSPGTPLAMVVGLEVVIVVVALEMVKVILLVMLEVIEMKKMVVIVVTRSIIVVAERLNNSTKHPYEGSIK